MAKLKKSKNKLAQKGQILEGIVSFGKSGNFAFVDTPTEGIFVPGKFTYGAVDGDTVLVEITPSDSIDRRTHSNGKREGKIIEILQRAHNILTGVYEDHGRYGFVIPQKSIGRDIHVYSDKAGEAKTGDLVSVQIVDWGTADHKPEGEIVEILGKPDVGDDLISAVLAREGLSEVFPDDVKANASDVLTIKPDWDNRRDLRDLPIITIDGDDAKDFDDAVYVDKLPSGNYRLIVSIADVSYYVAPGSPLDKEAYNRGNSVYLVDRVLPMLPEELSNDVCSLNEHTDKLTFTCEMEFDPAGKMVDSHIYKSVIKSVHRMTYHKVNKILAKDPELCEEYSDILALIQNMYELSRIIRANRYKRGCIDFDLSEIKVNLDSDNKPIGVSTRERGESERIIEDFMIAANETVAEYITNIGVPSVYRTHEKPDPEKIKSLNETLGKFGIYIPHADRVHPKQLQDIVEKSHDHPMSALIHKMVLMAMKQARYTADNSGHFGLASQCYTHFTSPIRRYADLMVHRVLWSLIAKSKDKKNAMRLGNIVPTCEHISNTERIAMRVEEETTLIKVIEYMKEKLGEEFQGVITGFAQKKVFFETEEHIECYWDVVEAKGFYELNERDYTMKNRNTGEVYNIGDKLPITLVRASITDLELEVVPTKFLANNNK